MVVSGGGLLVLFALLLIFCYLLWAVLPLFRAPAVGAATTLASYQAPPASSCVVPPLSFVPPASRDDELQANGALFILAAGATSGWAWAIDCAGRGLARPLNGARAPDPVALLAQPTHVARASGGQPLYWLTDASGQGTLARVDSAADGAPVWGQPFGGVQVIDPARRPLRRTAQAYPDAERAVAAAQLADGQVVVLHYSTAAGTVTVQRQPLTPPGQEVDRLLLSPDGRLLYLLSGSLLSLWRLDETGAWLRQRVALAPAGPLSLFMLPVEGALLVRDGAGHLSLWFDTARDTGPQLTPILTYAVTLDAGARLLAPARRGGFAVLDAGGRLTFFSTRDGHPRGHLTLPGFARPDAGAFAGKPQADGRGGVLAGTLSADEGTAPDAAGGGASHNPAAAPASLAALSPQGDALVSADPDAWRVWALSPGSPELGRRTLTQKIWYPGYPAPAWVWQSTPAGDSFAAGKYSLVPLAVGTLKAAACAMLFATPLALAAAMYSAWFMSAGLRRWVKPAMEIMGAVPSVIVGVIAGLWLVPHLATALGGLVLLPLLILAAAYLAGRLPPRWRRRWPAGLECLCLLPLIALVLWGCFTLTPPLERLLFGMPLSQALGEHYNPLNALVVGIAMGFALIPLLFTLAEEALFGVPTRLI